MYTKNKPRDKTLNERKESSNLHQGLQEDQRYQHKIDSTAHSKGRDVDIEATKKELKQRRDIQTLGYLRVRR